MMSSLAPCTRSGLGTNRASACRSRVSFSTSTKHRQAQQKQHLPRLCAATDQDVDLEDELEKFMKVQAEIESGAAFARTKDVAGVIGADLVPDDEARRLCRAIIDGIKLLKETRDMSFNECKLVISIEDPRMREARSRDIEDARGVSRDEMALALMEVAEGRIPKDRVALKCLHDELVEWPYLQRLEESSSSSGSGGGAGGAGGAVEASSKGAIAAAAAQDLGLPYAGASDVGSIAKPYVMGEDARKGDKPQTLADLLPDWAGFGVLYGIRAIPVMLAVGCLLILFYNSLR